MKSKCFLPIGLFNVYFHSWCSENFGKDSTMCTQSLSGSSLLSGYDNIHETSGRSRRDFEQIDAVLYDEESPKRSSIKKICDEWSSKPHFRIRGSIYPSERSANVSRSERNFNNSSSAVTNSMAISSADRFNDAIEKVSSFSIDESNVLPDDIQSRHSSTASIEGSELPNKDDFDEEYDEDEDDDAATIHPTSENFSYGPAVDSFDTDDDDDEDDRLSELSRKIRAHHFQNPLQCLKDTVVNQLAMLIFNQFINDQRSTLERYVKRTYQKNVVQLRPKSRPLSLPPRPISRNRLSLPTSSLTPLTNGFYAQAPLIGSLASRTTPESYRELTDFLLVKKLRTPQHGSTLNMVTSPRKSQVGTPVTQPSSTEKNFDRRSVSQHPIALIGTAVANIPSSQPAPPRSSQNPIRQISSSWSYRSAATLVSNPTVQEQISRLPPITTERLMNNDYLTISRSNTLSGSAIDLVGPVSKTNNNTTGTSNSLSSGKLRTFTSNVRLSRASRSLVGTSYQMKDNHSTSTSPSRSIAAGAVSTTSLRTTAAPRVQHHPSKRSLITTKGSTPPSTSNSIKISAAHVYQMTN